MSDEEPTFDLIGIDDTILETHPPTSCEGEFCCVHNPSDHPLKNAQQHWRADRGMMERICAHGVGHPDPDDVDFHRRIQGEKFAAAWGTHGCDGCCSGTGPQ